VREIGARAIEAEAEARAEQAAFFGVELHDPPRQLTAHGRHGPRRR
jgi:hypothetical protein